MFTEQAQFPNTRMRRLRNKKFSRELVSESTLSVQDLIYPMFVIEGSGAPEPIDSMPGINRLCIADAIKDAQLLQSLGVQAIALFPSINQDTKSEDAKEAFNPDGLMQRAIAAIKDKLPELGVITDCALDPYTMSGQDGLTCQSGKILNDATIDVLVKQAISHAKSGADMVAPSDMMDGRIGKIREALEQEGLINVQILSYAAKYASNFYGPFRDAVGSKGNLKNSDKNTYQMDPRNINEAIREVALDIQEGADVIMVKPGLPYLDVIHAIKTEFNIPLFAYHVSGEYAMLQAASAKGWIDEKAATIESLVAMKRAGANAIFSYSTKSVAKWLAS